MLGHALGLVNFLYETLQEAVSAMCGYHLAYYDSQYPPMRPGVRPARSKSGYLSTSNSALYIGIVRDHTSRNRNRHILTDMGRMVVEGALRQYAEYLNSFQITEFVGNAWEDVEILCVSSILHYREQLRPQVQRQITEHTSSTMQGQLETAPVVIEVKNLVLPGWASTNDCLLGALQDTQKFHYK